MLILKWSGQNCSRKTVLDNLCCFFPPLVTYFTWHTESGISYNLIFSNEINWFRDETIIGTNIFSTCVSQILHGTCLYLYCTIICCISEIKIYLGVLNFYLLSPATMVRRQAGEDLPGLSTKWHRVIMAVYGTYIPMPDWIIGST